MMTNRSGFVLSVTGVFLLASLLTGCAGPVNRVTLIYGPDNKTVTLNPGTVRCSNDEVRGTSVGRKPTGGFSLEIKNDERRTRGMVNVTGSEFLHFTTDDAVSYAADGNSVSFANLTGSVTVYPTNLDELPPFDFDNIELGEGTEFHGTVSGTVTCTPKFDTRTATP